MDFRGERSDGAIVAVALHSYIIERERRGQRVTQLAASQIISAAERMGTRPARSLQLLGFRVKGEIIDRLAPDVHLRAFRCVLETNNICRVLSLVARFQGRSVDDLECAQGGYRWRARDYAHMACVRIEADRVGSSR